MKIGTLFGAILYFSVSIIFGQEKVYNTFSTTRIGNGHSTETLWKKELDLFFGHKFGDYSNGLKNTFNATDVAFGADYGITNDMQAGYSISKGAGPYKELINGYLKYKVIQQEKVGNPINFTLLANTAYTTMEASLDSTSPVSFKSWEHRLSYTFQALISKKINERFSLQIAPALSHRNYVAFEDVNTIASIGFASRYQLNKILGITLEYYLTLPNKRTVLGQTYYDPLTLSLEFNTGGHVFRILFSNSAGFGESQFIPYTNSTWKNGGFRLGFAFGRLFKM